MQRWRALEWMQIIKTLRKTCLISTTENVANYRPKYKIALAHPTNHGEDIAQTFRRGDRRHDGIEPIWAGESFHQAGNRPDG